MLGLYIYISIRVIYVCIYILGLYIYKGLYRDNGKENVNCYLWPSSCATADGDGTDVKQKVSNSPRLLSLYPKP